MADNESNDEEQNQKTTKKIKSSKPSSKTNTPKDSPRSSRESSTSTTSTKTPSSSAKGTPKATPKDLSPRNSPRSSRESSTSTKSTPKLSRNNTQKDKEVDEEDDEEKDGKDNEKQKKSRLKVSQPTKQQPSPKKDFDPEFYEISSYVDPSVDLSDSLPPINKKLSEEALAKIKEFREHPSVGKYLKPHHHDFYINRWLLARKYDVEKAVDMFVESMKWREEVGADNILETLPKWEHFEKIAKYWPGSLLNMCPHTIDGSLVMYEALGRCDPQMLEFFGIDNIIKYHIYVMEKVQKIYWQLTEHYGYFPGIVVIQDLTGVGWNSFSDTVRKTMQKVIAINQNNYPDQLRKMYVVNSPSFVNMVWNVVSVWLDPRTLAKFEFLNGQENIKSKFTKIIHDSDLPKRLGGNSEIDIPQGGPMEKPKSTNGNKKQKVEVARAGNHIIKLETQKDDVIKWEFKTKLYDISFGVFLHRDSEKGSPQEILAVTRYNSHKEVVEGNTVITSDGILELQWDNTYSWTRGKTLKFTIFKNSEIITV